MSKERLDLLLVSGGFAETREKAKALIMAGAVYVNGQKEEKAGTTFPPQAQIEVRGHTLKYVSRGGFKLEKALSVFPVSVKELTCMDVGASTGGFTDCMLQNGARRVYAVDVGRGQLAWSLRQDERVVCMEKTNVRYLKPEDIPERIEFSSVDVSFISLSLILPAVKEVLAPAAHMICLIKPQFEAGREKVGKKGVVREPSVHEEVIRRVVDFSRALGFLVLGLDFSPIKGPEGNIEYLMHLQKGEEQRAEALQACSDSAPETLPEDQVHKFDSDLPHRREADISDEEIASLVRRAHETLHTS